MTSEPSTSAELLVTENPLLIQEALAQAGVIRQKQTGVSSNISSSKHSPAHVAISLHPLIPVIRLLLKKCENAALNFDRESFEMDDVKNLFKSLEESGVQLNEEKNEIDLFMENAVLTLRQCMVEIERVYVLSECFKTKYLSVLRKSVCHEALVGNSGDSDDEQSENMSNKYDSIRLQDAVFQEQANTVGSSLAALQNSGTFPFPLSLTQPPFSIIPSAQQLEQNMEVLRQCGILVANMPSCLEDAIKTIQNIQNRRGTTPLVVKTPDKSEEEKSRNRQSSKTPDDI